MIALIEAVDSASDPDRMLIRAGASAMPVDEMPEDIRPLFDRPVLAMHLGAGNETKQWPVQNFALVADILRRDNEIGIVLVGGPDEAEAARWCKDHMKKPVVGFIAGVTAPPGKRMGHAGALISGGADTADAKLAVMEECGFKVTRNPSEMGRILKSLL